MLLYLQLRIILRRIFSQFGNKVRLCIANGRHGFTTAIEFPNEKGHKVNVLLSDVGDNSDFGPERISYQKYLDILANANAVAVVNWATNLKGSQLAEYAFKLSPKALHFLAPADIKTRNKEFRDYLKEIAGILDILSINENECNWLAKAIGCGILLHEGSYNTDNVRSAAKVKLESEMSICIQGLARHGLMGIRVHSALVLNAK
jgi:hypothetical protein